MFFEGFSLQHTTIAGTRYRFRAGGAGRPLLLLHGQPQTHAMWHRVAPLLAAAGFHVVCPDLPGHLPEAELALDLLRLMDALGHDRFGVAGHDFGAHVACRLSLDVPERVERLAVVEVVPVLDHVGRADMSFALSGYRGCWFGQLHPKPEALAVKAPDEWFRLAAPDEPRDFFDAEAVADYLLEGAWNEERRGHGAAAEGPVPALDMMERGQRRRIPCPMMVIWGRRGRIGGWYDPRTLWQHCAAHEVLGSELDSGHFVAEEAPEALAALLEPFFSEALAEPAEPMPPSRATPDSSS
ncbi:alpha/beta hydrolase [Rhizosaccharibacter radicis]|uniref:Alpha/beta hydrolase n=1 Tax=Rhizosaccharibacter radicis TaxID=2782605 RepID=A0ABT1VYA2_9PROT|nr:alpha/beta hydrolase [Acetobacteraceae bacterium KSS12]